MRTSLLAAATDPIPGQPTVAGPDSLLGWTIALTSAGPVEALAAPLRQRGASVLSVPTVWLQPLADDPGLVQATSQVLEEPLDVLVTTSAHGFRWWLDACDSWGVGEAVRARLATTAVLARGAKARAAALEAGLVDSTRGGAESTWHLLGELLGMPLRGLRIAVVLHGGPVPDLIGVLRTAGAHVIELPVYRSCAPTDPAGVGRLLDQIRLGQVQAITFTSSTAAVNLLAAADSSGVLEQVLARLSDDVTAFAVGQVAAAPFEQLAIPVVTPEQPRLGHLLRTVTDVLRRRGGPCMAGTHVIEPRGCGALVDEVWRPLSPAPMAVLRMLTRRPGHVVSIPALLSSLPGGSTDQHTVEMAVRRLRAGLGDAACVENVMKRGYRLAAPAARRLEVLG